MAKKEKKKDEFFVDMNKFKEIHIYTPDGKISFDTKGLAQIEGYGMFEKNKITKVLKRIINGEGVLKIKNEKIDLTMQTRKPDIVFYD